MTPVRSTSSSDPGTPVAMGMYEQISRNKRRTFVMLGAFVFLIAVVTS